MQPESLDFKPERGRRWPGVLLVLAIGAALAVGFSYRALNDELALQQGALSRANRDRPHRMTAAEGGKPELLEARMKYARLVLHRLSLPWDGLFQVLEGATTDRVGLLALQPDWENGVINITAEAKEFSDMLTYVARLGETKSFSRIHLRHHEIDQNDPQRPIRFTLSARWSISP